MVTGITEHGIWFPSAIGWQNLVATQFHPEKSGRFGLANPEEFPGLGRCVCLASGSSPVWTSGTAKPPRASSSPDNVDIGDPVAMARQYYEDGADEIVFYDITASSDRRNIMIDVVRRVAPEIFIPFSVGGGIRALDDMRAVLMAGAEKVSVNTAAVQNPGIIAEGARAFGSQCIVLGMDVKKVEASAARSLRATRW